MPGTLAPDEVCPLLTGRFGHPYFYEIACESTQGRLDGGLREGAVAVCEEQTGGRGRLGRRWSAPPGAAILCSLLLRPPGGRAAAELSLVGGLAVAEAVELAASCEAAIKWPNDVLVAGAKVAGVLAEMHGDAVIVGFGVNVNQTASELPDRPRFPAASLRTLDGRVRERAPILASVLERLEALYETWCQDGLTPVLARILVRDALRGLPVTIGDVQGIARGIAPDGRLELETAAGLRLVAGGEVCTRTAATL